MSFFRMARSGLILLVLVLVVAGCGRGKIARTEAEERDYVLYRKAVEAESVGRLDDAIACYQELLMEKPRTASAHFQLALLMHDQRQDYVEAIHHYKRYLALRPGSDKQAVAESRVRIAEQLLAAQLLRRVGDQVEGLSQAKLLKDNERLNRELARMEGDLASATKEKIEAGRREAQLKDESERLRRILDQLKTDEGKAPPASVFDRFARPEAEAEPAVRRSTRDEIAAARGAITESQTAPKVSEREPEPVLPDVRPPAAVQPTVAPAIADRGKSASSSPLKIPNPLKTAKRPSGAAAPARTYVVQPGDSMFRIAEKFYGDSSEWKKIRDANRNQIDPDGRLRAGQILQIP